MVNTALSTIALTPPVMWAGKATDGFSHWPEPVNVAHAPPNAWERDDAVCKVKERFVDVIAGFKSRNGHKELALSDAERAYAQEKYKDLEVLAEKRSSNGFYGVLLYDRTTKSTLLAYPGADFPASAGRMAGDIDDMLFEGSGGPVSQTRTAIRFAEEAERISREKTGHGVRYFTGYSLGAYNGYFVAGTNTLPDAEFFFYEGPGINSTTVKFCSRYSKLGEAEIIKNYQDRCYSFMPERNLVNAMNTHPGTVLTLLNDNCGSFYYPEAHSFDDTRVEQLSNAKPMIDRESGESSPAIPAAFAIFGALAILPWVVGAARRTVAHYAEGMARGIDAPYQQRVKDERDKAKDTDEPTPRRA